MEKTFNFGKIDWFGCGKKINEVDLLVRYERQGGKPTYLNGEPTGKTTPMYYELGISAKVWNAPHTDIVAGGQCLEEINSFLVGNKLWDELFRFWKNYHLNGMHAGTPEQEQALKEFHENGGGHDFKVECAYLKYCGLYEVNFTGMTVGRYWDNEPYRYGSAWIIQLLPKEEEERLFSIMLGYVK